MFENVAKFLLFGPYVGIWELIVGIFVKLIIHIFCNYLTRILTNKSLFLTIFTASPPIVTPFDSPFSVDFRPPYNTKYTIDLSRPG